MAKVLLTRRVPSSVLAPLEAQHELEVWPGDDAIPREALGKKAAAVDAAIIGIIDAVEVDA